MDLLKHSKKVDILTKIFNLSPTVTNLLLLRNAIRCMESTCEELLVEHPDNHKQRGYYG